MKKTILTQFILVIALFSGLSHGSYVSHVSPASHEKSVEKIPFASDFEFNSQITVSGDASLYKFELPEHVYKRGVDPYLKDVYIFNNNGPVPFSIENIATEKKVEESSYEIPFFKTYQEIKGSENLSLNINSENNINLNINNSEQSKSIDESLYIDLEKVKSYQGALKELAFNWSFNAPGNYIFSVTIDKSNDLENWYHNSSKKMVDFSLGPNKLKENLISLSPVGNYRFLRIKIDSDQKLPIIGSITGKFSEVTNIKPKRWHSVKLLQNTNDPQEYTFESGGNFIIDSIRITPNQANSLFTAYIYSRNNKEQKWRFRAKDEIYTIQNNGNEVKHDEVSFYRNLDKYWMIKFDTIFTGNSKDGTEAYLPKIEFNWVPHEITFLATGEGPFVLAYGNDAKDLSYKSGLTSKINLDNEQLKISDSVVVESPIRNDIVKTIEEKPFWERYKTQILWLIIILFVLFMLYMSSKLYKEISSEKED